MLRKFRIQLWSSPLFDLVDQEVFYGTQYHLVPPAEKDSYVVEKDLYVRIRRLRFILYHRFV
jgi:hypothetical protein